MYKWKRMEDRGGERTDLVSLTGIIYAHRMLALGKKSYLVLL